METDFNYRTGLPINSFSYHAQRAVVTFGEKIYVRVVNGNKKLRTDAWVEPEHTLPAHTVVELCRRRVFAHAIRSQRRPQYAENRLAARRRRSRTPAGRLVHGTRLFERLEPKPVWMKTVHVNTTIAFTGTRYQKSVPNHGIISKV